jgi:hypothetical protein
MDYAFDDETRFHKYLRKTDPFARMVTKERLIVKTNAYPVYKKYKVNTSGYVGHIFVLTAAGFLHSEHFTQLHIAADYRADQQFVSHPYGSNLATNPLIHDGVSYLVTDSQELTRSQKLPFLLRSKQALESLVFCQDYSKLPYNCGKCSKCMRTKLMFLASTGEIPDIFVDIAVPKNWLDAFDLRENMQRVFLIDLLMCAKRNDRMELVPGANEVWQSIKADPTYSISMADMRTLIAQSKTGRVALKNLKNAVLKRLRTILHGENGAD